MAKRSVRGGWVLIIIAIVGALVLAIAPAPYVIEQPGPVFNTLGTSARLGSANNGKDAKRLIVIDDHPTYDTAGQLDMLTVSSIGNRQSRPDWLQVLQGWADPQKAVIPLDVAYPPSQTTKQVTEAEQAQMANSQQDAVAAALNQLGYDFPQAIMVKNVLDNYPAAGKLKPDDQIVSVNGSPVTGIRSLQNAVKKNGTTSAATIRIIRNGESKTATITPVKSGTSAVIGIGVSMDYTFPFRVKIQLNNVGGPSAGMMFALGIIDKLTPGHLNGGEDVAGTGTIDSEGYVGPIGGIRQKLYGADHAGAEWFLAPASNCDEVTGHVPDGLHVVAVKKLSDSLRALTTIASGKGTGALPTCAAG